MQHYSQAQAAGLWSRPAPNRASVAAIAGCLGPCPSKSGWSPRTEIPHHFGPCAVTSLSSLRTTLSLSEDKPVQSTAKTLDESNQVDTWALCQPVVSVYQTKFPLSFTVFHSAKSVNIYFNLLSKTGMGKLFTIVNESTHFFHLLPLAKVLKWKCYLSRT